MTNIDDLIIKIEDKLDLTDFEREFIVDALIYYKEMNS